MRTRRSCIVRTGDRASSAQDRIAGHGKHAGGVRSGDNTLLPPRTRGRGRGGCSGKRLRLPIKVVAETVFSRQTQPLALLRQKVGAAHSRQQNETRPQSNTVSRRRPLSFLHCSIAKPSYSCKSPLEHLQPPASPLPYTMSNTPVATVPPYTSGSYY